MAKCKCGRDAWPNRRVCQICLKNWSDMKGKAFHFIEGKYGKLNAENHPIFKTEMRRLEKIWRKDSNKFEIEINEGG